MLKITESPNPSLLASGYLSYHNDFCLFWVTKDLYTDYVRHIVRNCSGYHENSSREPKIYYRKGNIWSWIRIAIHQCRQNVKKMFVVYYGKIPSTMVANFTRRPRGTKFIQFPLSNETVFPARIHKYPSASFTEVRGGPRELFSFILLTTANYQVDYCVFLCSR